MNCLLCASLRLDGQAADLHAPGSMLTDLVRSDVPASR
jgi:hypothetical protein